MRLYIIRHADPDYENNTITPTGHIEAQALACHLAQLGIDEIFSSPFGRAVHTAQYTADALQLPVQIADWARELDELWIEELNKTFYDPDGALMRPNDILAGHNHLQEVSPMNHPVIQKNLNWFCQGSDAFLECQGYVRENNAYRVIGENRKKIAIFTHRGVGLTWLSHLLAIPLPLMWAGFFLPPSSVTTVLFDERVPGLAMPRCLGMGDISHLCKAGLQPSPAGIIANFF